MPFESGSFDPFRVMSFLIMVSTSGLISPPTTIIINWLMLRINICLGNKIKKAGRWKDRGGEVLLRTRNSNT